MSAYEIPDGIEPVEGWRFWNFDNHGLSSLNGTRWLPGQRLEAVHPATPPVYANPYAFHPPSYQWEVVKGPGLTRAQAEAQVTAYAVVGQLPAPPRTTLPYGYALRLIAADSNHPICIAPERGCTCGIYAGSSLADCPDGKVFGKVLLWGKIIPGEKGWRAQYAYPSELWAPERIARHPALLAYGVPISACEAPEPPERPEVPKLRKTRAAMLGATAFNLGAGFFALRGWWL